MQAVQHLASNQQRSMRSRAGKRKRTEADVPLHFAIQLGPRSGTNENGRNFCLGILEHPVQDESWENSKFQHLMNAARVEAVVFNRSLV